MQNNRFRKRRRMLVVPLGRLFPNMVTIAGMCCGLSSIRFAMEDRFEVAVTLLVAAAIFDAMDGRIARLLNSTSLFGAQLDSLSDFACFGIAPGIVLYFWKLHFLKGIGWALVLFFAVCCLLRLARFNTNLAEETREAWQRKFFTGIPSPAAAMLSLMPLVISFYTPPGIFDNYIACALWVTCIAVLMPSRIPTFAAKKIRIHHEWVLPVMIICGLSIVLVVIAPWMMFTFCGLLYCATIPIGIRRYRRLQAIHKNPSAVLSEISSV